MYSSCVDVHEPNNMGSEVLLCVYMGCCSMCEIDIFCEE